MLHGVNSNHKRTHQPPASVQPQNWLPESKNKSRMKLFAAAFPPHDNHSRAVPPLRPGLGHSQRRAGYLAGTADQRGRTLIDQMIAALGGDAWLNRTSIQTEAHGSAILPRRAQPLHRRVQEIERFAASAAASRSPNASASSPRAA